MSWKKLLETKDLIAYEKCSKSVKVRLEARFKKRRWRIYKTYNFRTGNDWISHVKEYIAGSDEEAYALMGDLRKEKDITLNEINRIGVLRLELKRCYKEDFVEKWKFNIDGFNEDNFIILRYDSEIKMDIILHDRYNNLEKQILNKIIDSLGLKDLSNKICYDFFYFKKHSAKRIIYKSPKDKELIAQLEFNVNNVNHNIDKTDDHEF